MHDTWSSLDLDSLSGKIVEPTPLVVHGGHDVRVPLDQGIGAYSAAQLRHVPSELLYFPDENHWVLKPRNSVEWYATVEAWMRRWLGQ
jgi:dipeptidyl aminopeptidase/acylaminoacyl peptidase